MVEDAEAGEEALADRALVRSPTEAQDGAGVVAVGVAVAGAAVDGINPISQIPNKPVRQALASPPSSRA